MLIRITAVALALLATTGGAQTTNRDSLHGGWSFGLWGGIARNSPTTIWGTTGGRDVAITALRFGRTMLRSEHVAIDYSLDLVPAAWLTMPPPDVGTGLICTIRDGVMVACRPKRAYQEPPAYGVGAAPLGFAMRLLPGQRVQPYVSASTGMMWFRRPVPDERASKHNFTLEAGGGLLVRLPARLGLALGYKLYHISNAGTAPSNPGLDNHMVYLAVMRRAESR